MAEKRGMELLQDPRLNKSTAFTDSEKEQFGLIGLLPEVSESEDLQLQRVMLQLGQKSTDLDRYIYLVNLLDHNETLFYRTVMSDPARFLPLVYDPTIGESCLKFGHIYRQTRGMYLSIKRRGEVRKFSATGRKKMFGSLRHRWRADPRSGRSWRQRRRNSDRQTSALHGLRRGPPGLTSALDPILLAGRQYWITISSSVNYAIVWNNNSTGDKNAQAVSSDGGATWFAPTGATPGALEVNGIFIPEPSAGLLAGSGLIVAWRRKRMPGEGAEKRPDRN